MGERRYRLGKRAEAQEATRARIVDAVMQLHEELGPRKATVTAIAGRAGVQRLTVYRHFPDETELFRACTSRWLELHPPPDPAAWSGIEEGPDRCRAAFTRLYGYYSATRGMWAASFRDEPDVPALQPPMQAFRAYLDDIADDLLAVLAPDHDPGAALSATIGHLLRFSTWTSLDEEGLSDGEAAELAVAWVNAALPVPDERSGGAVHRAGTSAIGRKRCR